VSYPAYLHVAQADENVVLCRALRDFNVPKITTMDMPIFLRLIQDLFPGISPEPFKDPGFEKTCADIVRRRRLQSDAGFIQKVAGLLEILHVRHCCFIIGPTGCGKTECWMSLMEAVKEIGQDGMWEQVNPKAITSDELYGTMSKTKEWKDGAIAVIIRNMSKEINGYKPSHAHKWLVLDGDIDATWIESMNTVMDDNKVLTLVSNERIPFTPTMRMLLEIQDMKHASPATVSRGGVLFINEADVGWKPYVESWREQMGSVQQSSFYLLFANYFEQNIEQFRNMFSFSCPILDIGFVQSITCMIDALLHEGRKETVEAMRQLSVEEQKQVYEAYFVYSMMWAIGGAVADDKVINQRKNFSGQMRALCRGIKIPDAGEIFDYSFDVPTKEWVHWENSVVPYNPIADRMYQNIVISNVELERTKCVVDLHTRRQKPVLLVGVAGTGKTTIIKDYLAEVKLDRENCEGINSAAINLNSYTTSEALQAIFMGSLDKRTGTIYGPPGQKKCIFFVDDLNMPYVDTYDTQAAIMLLTQIMSYKQVYDRAHLDEKRNLVDILFTACMNPKAGSFMINARLQRHFTVLTAHSPSATNIAGIYTKILGRHLEGFDSSTRKYAEAIVAATSDVLTAIQNTPCFLPSGEKFHYQFNLKDISNIFQGLLNTEAAMYKKGLSDFLRVWAHEAQRVLCDRLVSQSDLTEMQILLEKAASKNFLGAANVKDLFEQPLVMTSFESDCKGHGLHYLQAKSVPALKKVVEGKLDVYNEENPAMNLVLFDDAVLHVCRICRVTSNPCGNALLVGVGGSGKQSLARLASFINGQPVLTILVNLNYGLNELKADFQEFYKKAAVKPREPHAFLMTDSQITDERFLVFVNDMLSSGNIPDLFAREEYDDIFNQVRNVAKYQGYADDRDSLFQFFLDMVRRNLHLILCHSPVGSAFRIRGRKFPALISCMCLDVFQPWPLDALEGVAARFLQSLESMVNIDGEDLLEQATPRLS
jgi:dynein heavy chain